MQVELKSASGRPSSDTRRQRLQGSACDREWQQEGDRRKTRQEWCGLTCEAAAATVREQRHALHVAAEWRETEQRRRERVQARTGRPRRRSLPVLQHPSTPAAWSSMAAHLQRGGRGHGLGARAAAAADQGAEREGDHHHRGARRHRQRVDAVQAQAADVQVGEVESGQLQGGQLQGREVHGGQGRQPAGGAAEGRGLGRRRSSQRRVGREAGGQLGGRLERGCSGALLLALLLGAAAHCRPRAGARGALHGCQTRPTMPWQWEVCGIVRAPLPRNPSCYPSHTGGGGSSQHGPRPVRHG